MARWPAQTVFEVNVDDLTEGTFDDEREAREFMKGIYDGTVRVELVKVTRQKLAEIEPK
jgi:hypothetical protein